MSETESPDHTNGLQEALRQEITDLDNRLDELERREEEINKDLNAVQIEKKRYEDLREHARALLYHREQSVPPDEYSPSPAMMSVPAEDQEMSSENLSSRRETPKRRTTGDSLTSAVRSVLKGTERPPGQPGQAMHYRDLVAHLEERGIYIPGRDKGLNLVAHIHKDPSFVRPKRGMYGLREWYPSEQYNVGQRSTSRPKGTKGK
jgi:TolA-binding protein